jgi:hypothetical protein
VNITCEDSERILLDGTPEEWAALEQHATDCARCTEELGSWKQLSSAAAELREYQESPALWTRIETSLREQQAVVRPHRNFWQALDVWRHLSHGWQMAVVGAMVVALTVSGAYLFTRRDQGKPDQNAHLLKRGALAEVERTERDYMAAIDKLAAEASPQLNADTPLMASYREKLLVLDSAISELRAQAGENPSNAHLRYQLLAMYQEKQQTLQDVLETKR